MAAAEEPICWEDAGDPRALLEYWIDTRMATETLARNKALAALQSEVGELRQQLAELAQAIISDAADGNSRAKRAESTQDGVQSAPGTKVSVADQVTLMEADHADATLRARGQAQLILLETGLADAKTRIAALESTQVATRASLIRDAPAGTADEANGLCCGGQDEKAGGPPPTVVAEDEAVVEDAPEERSLSSHMIDVGGSYTMGESVWECNLFAFHPCVGPWVSFFSVIALMCTIIIHVLFIVIVLNFMTGDPVSSEILDDLVLFRASAAHAVDQADVMTRNSISGQICNADDKLHLAGAQSSLYGDIQDFKQGGPLLMVLAQFAWLLLVLKEVTSTINFAHGFMSLPRAEVTKIIVAESAADEDYNPVQSPKDVRLHLAVTVARIQCLHKGRAFASAVVLVALRLVLAVVLGYAGVRFLAVTASMSDLVLNSMALGFVFDLGSMFYLLFVPRRMHTLVSNTEPLPVRSLSLLSQRNWQDVGYLVRIIGVLVFTVVCELALNQAFFWRLTQAEVILCGGNRDFVYAKNPATGVAHVARTNGMLSQYDFAAKAVIQAAAPPVEAGPGWDPDSGILDLIASSNNVSERLFYLEGMYNGTEFENALANEDLFDFVRTVSQQDVFAASAWTVCSDASTGLSDSAVVEMLRFTTNVQNLTGCSDPRLYDTCFMPMMVEVRATCPSSCKCPAFDYPLYFFQHPLHGCPHVCGTLRNAAMQAKDTGNCVDTDAPVLRTKIGVYAETMVAYARQNIYYTTQVANVIDAMRRESMWEMTDEYAQQLHYHAVHPAEDFGESLSKWQVMPDAPHPRNLTGCEFLTSWEILSLTGIDPCSPQSGRTIRFLCPEACFCSRGMEECPSSCNEARNP